MIGGYFDDHPWTDFRRPGDRGRPQISGDEGFPARIYDSRRNLSGKEFFARTRTGSSVWLDETKLDFCNNNPRVHRTDKDFRRRTGPEIMARVVCIHYDVWPYGRIVGRSSPADHVAGGNRMGNGPDAGRLRSAAAPLAA